MSLQCRFRGIFSRGSTGSQHTLLCQRPERDAAANGLAVPVVCLRGVPRRQSNLARAARAAVVHVRLIQWADHLGRFLALVCNVRHVGGGHGRV